MSQIDLLIADLFITQPSELIFFPRVSRCECLSDDSDEHFSTFARAGQTFRLTGPHWLLNFDCGAWSKSRSYSLPMWRLPVAFLHLS